MKTFHFLKQNIAMRKPRPERLRTGEAIVLYSSFFYVSMCFIFHFFKIIILHPTTG